MQEPADIGRKLLRFRTREEHAVIQRVEEAAFGYPVLLLDENAMHHRDLPSRSAEAENGDTHPHDERFAERDAVCVIRRGGLAYGKIRHGVTLRRLATVRR